MDRLRVEGTKVVDTRTLLRLVNAAEEEGFEHLLDDDVVRRLDPSGWHILCARPGLIGAGPERLSEDGQAVVDTEMELGAPIPCEVLLKLQGRQKSVERMLDVALMDFARLEDAPKTNRVMFDGETQRA